MPASRRSAAGFALACVPTRLPVWLGYKHPQSTGGGQSLHHQHQNIRVSVQTVGSWVLPITRSEMSFENFTFQLAPLVWCF